MTRDRLRGRGGLLALAVGVALAALVGAHTVAGGTRAFVVSGAYRLVLAFTPDAVVAASIVLLGELGDGLALAIAVLLTVGLFAGGVAAAVVLGRRRDSTLLAVGFASGLVSILSVALSGASATAIAASLVAGGCAGLALTAGVFAGRLQPGQATVAIPTDRRAAIGSLAAALGIGLFGSVARRSSPPDQHASIEELSLSTAERDEIESSLATAREHSLDVPELEPLVSDSFYEVDINQINPSVDRDDWTLTVTGAVEQNLTRTFDDLRERTAEHRFVTLRCVGESLNGHKMDNALWTGLPASVLLDEAGPRGRYVVLRAVDGYFEEFPLAALRRGFLAYGMNGAALPRRHGYPLRALVPGHWGEINVKWLSEIEVRDEPLKGYWERRGWHGTGPVNTVAKLHVTAREGDRLRVGGHAYAGVRGIDRVEVSTDGGGSWAEAALSTPLPGADVWRQWTHAYPSPGSSHEVVVRAIDGTGTVQPHTRQDAFPSGATGWVRERLSLKNFD